MNHSLSPSGNTSLAYHTLPKRFVAPIALALSLVIPGCGNRAENVAPESKPQPTIAQRDVHLQSDNLGEVGSLIDRVPPGTPQAVEPGSETSIVDHRLKNTNDPTRPSLRPLVHTSGERLTVAVLEFEKTSPADEFPRLDRALQSMLTTDLSVSRDLELVERARIQDVCDELNLAKTGFLDLTTAAKIGKGVGAKAVLIGSFWVRDATMRIDARLIHVETGTVILAEEITGVANEFTVLEKQLARKVLDAAGIRLSAIEIADLSIRHTSSLLAASRYGEALVAEDAGDLDVARRNAAAALELDAKFSLAEQLLQQLSKLLERARGDDFRRKVESLTRFEDSLNGHPFDHPRFKLEDYPKLLRGEGSERALFYWISHLGVGEADRNRENPYDLLFAHPDPMKSTDGAVSQLYLQLGGAGPVLFWCDVMTSDPKFSPSKSLTDDMLNPDWRSRPISGPYPSYFFWRLPDVFDKRFKAQAWIQGDFEKAIKTIESAHRVCGPLSSEGGYLRRLEELKDIISSPHRLHIKRSEAYAQQRVWKLARDQIVDLHRALQFSRFGDSREPSGIPTADEVRQDLVQEYAGKLVVMFGGRAEQEREAKQLVDRLLTEADGARFVVSATPVFNGDPAPESINVMHIAGCPESYIARLARGSATSLPNVGKSLRLSNDPQIGIKENCIPCPHCRPFRWTESGAVQAHLAKRLPEVSGRFIKTGSEASKMELNGLLIASLDAPTPSAHACLQLLCEHICNDPSGDRKLHATALQSMARITTPDDAKWLNGLLQSTPWWDVRINAAATLASVGDDQVIEMLQQAVEREPYYFVKHSLEAACARGRERIMRATLNEVAAKWSNGEFAAARASMETLLRSVLNEKQLLQPVRRRWEAQCHRLLSHACKKAGEVDLEIKHLRIVAEIIPDNPEYKNELGYALATHGQSLDEAEHLIRAAIVLDKQQNRTDREDPADNPFYLDSLGFVLFKLGRFAEAKEMVQKCLASPEGQMLESYDHLGEIHWALGEKEQAVAAWKKAVTIARDTPIEQEMKLKLAKKLRDRSTP